MINLENICDQVRDTAIHAGRYIAEEAARFDRSKIIVKGDNNFVSFVDKTAERMIVDSLSLILPEAGFIAEEGTSEKRGDKYNWIIDPLDGTTNFIHSAPPYSVSIGLIEGNEVILGVIYEITQQECFYSWKGAPSYLNGKIIKVSTIDTVKDSLVATGFPYTDYTNMQSSMKMLEHLFQYSHGVRRLGSAAADLAYLACGRFEVFYENGLHSWDVAGGDIIVRNAGGKISDYKGGNDYLFGRCVVASNGLIQNEFLSLINRFF